MHRIRFLIWKELIELGQDPRLFGIVVMAPIIQLFMLAYAATTDVRNVPIIFADADRTVSSRELIGRFDADRDIEHLSGVGVPLHIEPAIRVGA